MLWSGKERGNRGIFIGPEKDINLTDVFTSDVPDLISAMNSALLRFFLQTCFASHDGHSHVLDCIRCPFHFRVIKMKTRKVNS